MLYLGFLVGTINFWAGYKSLDYILVNTETLLIS